jgi:uncharacterized membrane protein YfcA
MLISPKRPGAGSKRMRRPLNVTGIKQGIVFVVGLITALGSAVTGLGAQAAYSPMLVWMFGYRADKAQAAGLTFACVAAVGAVLGALMGHAAPSAYLARGLALFFGAFLGALLAAKFAKQHRSLAWRRGCLTLGIGISLFVLARVGRLSMFDSPEYARWQSPLELIGLGFGVGIATQALSLPSGLLMVPALYLFGAFTPPETMALSMLVVALASLIPAIAYAQRGLGDASYGRAGLISALIGGVVGGRLLPPDHGHGLYSHRMLIGLSAVVAMFLCAREIARMAMETTDDA